MSPTVYVLILNYNGRAHLEYCLPSVLETDYPQIHVVLIDNGSSDDSLRFTRTLYPQVTVIENGCNLGYAAGNNVGVRYALERGADYVVLLNNDMRVDPRWLTHAVAVSEEDPRIGFVGFDTIGEYHLNADPDLTQFKRRQSAWQQLETRHTEHVAGCAMLVRAAVFCDIGLFDEAFFAYGEEDDLQRRARRAGYHCIRINVPLWHYNSGSFGRHALMTAVMAQRNHIRVMIKADLPRVALRRFFDMAYFICRPGIPYDHTHAHLRRLRPSIYPVNVAILLYAIAWNLVMSPVTLLARYRDGRRIHVARQRLAALQSAGHGDEL
jgi:GT2 family glycosyltransferase